SQNLVPAFHALAVLGQNRLHAAIEISLQSVIVFDLLFMHPELNAFIPVPILAVHFVAADVKILIRKERGHLAENGVESCIGGGERRIESGTLAICHATNDMRRGHSRGKFWESDQPADRMCGDVEFGNDADAALVCVGNKLANLLLGIELPVGCQLLQPWSAAAFDAES